MKNKGFTLIELLAVIVILSVIAIIATPVVINVIESSKNKSYERQEQLIIEAAKRWGTDNAALVESGYSVPVKDLQKGGYLTNKKVLNPKDKSDMTLGCVSITHADNQYDYKYQKTCTK